MESPRVECLKSYQLPRVRRAQPNAYGDERPDPTTPAGWFCCQYPDLAVRYGSPMLEETVADPLTRNKQIRPVALNDNFFAAIVSDRPLGHSVAYFEPEQQWYFLEPRDNCYHPTTEAKLMNLLSALLIRCAEAMPSNVDVADLFVGFREEQQLKAVVKKARSILAADSTFFSTDSPNRRISERATPQTTAKQFILSAVRPAPDNLLSIQDCFTSFAGYCKNQGVEAVERRYFKRIIAEVIREEFGVSLRGDLKDQDGRYLRGWKGLTVELGAVARN